MKKAIIGAVALAAAFASEATTGYVDGKTVVPGVSYASSPGRFIPHRTEFVFSDDGNALAISFDVDFPMGILDATKGVWSTGDCLEIWLDPSGEGKKVMQFAIDPFGRRWDRRAPASDASAYSWTSEVARGASGWKAKVRLPYSDLGVQPPKKGDRWTVNVCRTFSDSGGARTISTWANVGANFKNPGKFAELLFGSPEEVAEIARRRRIAETAALRKELAEKGYARHFAFKLKRLEDGATDVLIQEIRDEVRMLDAMKAADLHL